jgi:hypothetical protein
LEELDRERPDLVRESLGYLGLARRGLTEGELLELLSDKLIPLSSPLPRHYWSPLYLALADSLVSRSGQLGFFHDYLKQAVESEYLDEDRERKKIHGRLGETALAWNTDKFGPTLRDYAMEHGISHLLEAGEIAAAVALCLDDGFFERSRNRLGSAGPFMQTIQAATERVARLCPENRDLEVALCRLALRQGQIRALLSRSLVFDHPPPSSLTPEAAATCASASRPLPLQHQWFYALGLLADSAERGGDTHQLREALRIFSQAWPKTVSMTGHDDTWSHFSSDQKEIQDARELLIPELLARLANVDAESAASLLLRLDEGNRLTQLCRCLIRLAKHGRVDAAEKLMHHPVAGGMFETTRPPFDFTPEEYQQQIAFLARQNFYRDFTPEEFVQWNLAKANIQYAIPVFWACYCSQSPALRNPKTIEAIESGLNLHKDHDDPFSLLSSCLSAIVSHGFEPPDSLRQRLQDIWEQEADWENNWYMIREKAREEDDFEEEGRRIRESLRPAMRCATKRRSITDIDWGQRPEQVSRAMRCATKRLPSQRVGSQVIRIARGSKHPLSAWSAQRYDQLKHLRKTRPRFDEFWKEWAAQEHGRLKHLRKTRPRFDGWWTRNGVAKALPDWLRLPARELYPRLLKQAQRGSKDSIRLRSADRFWHQLILFYHESERLGIWSDAQLRTLVTQLTGVDEKLHLIKQLSVGETVDEELQLLTGLYRSGQRDDKAGVTGRSSRTPYDLFVGALDYWSAAAAVVGLIAVRLRVDGALPPEIMNAIDEFAASA